MNAATRILALATALGLAACAAPPDPAAQAARPGQDAAVARAAPAAHVNPPETSSGY